MGGGYHGGFGGTKGSNSNRNEKRISLPSNRAQLDHIFGDRKGHLPDTPGNRKQLIDLANDKSMFIGKDKYGNSWHVRNNKDGSQLWVRHQGGTINEGGLNKKPRTWDSGTGLNNNPFKGGKKK